MNGSAYGMKVTSRTLESLSGLGMIQAIGSGHVAFPRNAMWRITDAGKAAIFKLPKTEP
jgi:hypothetical protein